MRGLLALLAVLLPSAAFASCGLVADRTDARVWRAATAPDTLTLSFLGHASYLIETPGGVRVVTDYNGVNIPADPPDVATMNHAHSTHYTDRPDPRIAHVLRGWSEDGKPPQIDFTLRDLHIRNIPTNIRDWGGGTEYYGNSIFVFESAGMCIAHLGHIHHLLTPDDLAAIGRVDVVMLPVDGMFTLNHKDALVVMEQLHAPVTIAMHYFARNVLDRFLERAGGKYPVRISETPMITLARPNLPEKPEIWVLPGGY